MNRRPEALSFLGKPLFTESTLVAADREALAAAVERSAAGLRQSDTPASRIALAKDLRAAGRYRAALQVLSEGLRRWPQDASLLADRGHTYVNVRDAAAAIRDLSLATSLAPRSFDAWYHYALALWFSGDFEAAAAAFKTTADVCQDASSRLAASTWWYTALRRAGHHEEAAAILSTIPWDVDLAGKNLNYQRRMRFYQGDLDEAALVEAAAAEKGTKSEGSLNFGLGIWYLAEGRTDAARSYFEAGAGSDYWPAFGVAACEAELARLDGVSFPEPETYSLLGEPLYAAVAHGPEERPALERAAEEARAAMEQAPDDVAAIRAYAKTLASGLAHYREAIALLDEAIARLPQETMLRCDRGHYLVNLRRFEEARAELSRAAEERPESHDIWYHLGLAHWMLGETEEALTAWRKALEASSLESHHVAYSDWIYLALRRLGRRDEAMDAIRSIHPDMVTTGNNHLYLKRLLFYQGAISEEELLRVFEQGGLAFASAFGLGCWHLCEGNEARANELFEQVVEGGTAWGGFAHVAAEAELARAAS